MKNDMKSILSAFDTAGDKNTRAPNAPKNDSMRTILESFDKVQEASSMNVSVSGDSPDEVIRMIQALNGNDSSTNTAPSSGPSMPSPDSYDTDHGNDGIDDAITGTLSQDGKTKQDEEYNNEPSEEYQDTDDMVNANSGGINKRKKSYKRAEPGDNPMSVKTEQLAQELRKSLREHFKRASKANNRKK